MFPDLSIKQLWLLNHKNLTLEEFWKERFEDHEMPTAKEIQQYKDLAMLQSARKSAGVNNPSPLELSTCDNSLGVSALPDTTSEDFKTVFKIAINQAGNPELAKKILQYNYPEDNSSDTTEVESNKEEEEVTLSQEQVQFFQSVVCAMILQDTPQSVEEIWQNVHKEAKNHEINIPVECPFVKGGKSALTEGANVGNFANKDSIILFSNQALNKQPRDVVQWFEMCFPNVHLPKAWEVLFPDTSIIELWQGSKILAADTFSKFCQIVFPNYELSEDTLHSRQKENLDLFLNYGPNDKFDTTKENLSSDFYNLFAETIHISPLNKPSREEEDQSATAPVENKNGTTPQEPTANKGFFSGVFSSFTGFVSWLFGSSKGSSTPEGTITPNQTENSNELTKTISNGDNTIPTPTTNTSEAPTPESKSFGGIIYDSIFSMFHEIGSWFGGSQATCVDPEQLKNHNMEVMGKTPGETTNDNSNLGED